MTHFYKRSVYVCVFTLIALFSLNSTFAQWTKLQADIPNLAYIGSGMSVVLNDKLYVFGGTNINPDGSGVYSDRAWSLDLKQTNAEWEELNSMPSPRIAGYAAAYNGKIYIVGGFFGNPAQYQTSVLEYDPAINDYNVKSDIPTPCQYIGGAIMNGKIYVFGGLSASGPLSEVQVYDIAKDEWTSGTELPYSCGYAAGVAVGNTLYVGGGFTNGVFQSVFYKGTEVNNAIEWTELANLPFPIASPAAGSLGANVFFCGGLVNGNAANTMFKYDIAKDEWTTSFGMTVAPYFNNSLPSYDNALYSVSGEGVGPGTYKFVDGPPAAIALYLPKTYEYTLRNSKTITRKLSLGNLGNIPLTASFVVKDAPWLTTQQNITIEPNSLQRIDFQINPTGLAENTYNGQIVITTNDNNQKEIIVNVVLTVNNSVVDRKPIIEAFSSSTCGPCKPGNEAIANVLSEFSPEEYTMVKYQQYFPGTGDPYTTSETIARGTVFKANEGIPRMALDGVLLGDPRTKFSSDVLTEAQDKVASVVLNSSYSITDKKVNISVDIEPLTDITSKNVRLFVAIAEKETSKNIKSNGETKFHHVVKKMLPNASGTAITDLKKNEKISKTFEFEFPGNYRLPKDGQNANIIKLNTEHSVEEFSDLEVVVWLNDVTAGSSFNSSAASIVSSVEELPDNSGLSFLEVYPNPTAGMTTFRFKAEKAMNVTLELFDLAGNKVASLFNAAVAPGEYPVMFDMATLPTGQYNMWLKTNDKFIGRTITVTK